jgi:hypothetical protein
MLKNLPKNKSDIFLFLLGAVVTVFLFSFEPTFLIRQPMFYILLAAAGVHLLFHFKVFEIPKKINRLSFPAMVLLSAIMTGMLVGQSLKAEWGPIDDHEIMYYLGTDQKTNLAEIPKFLKQSEAGRPGQALRYRPVYQLIRITETALWGNNAHLWYGFRLVMMIAALSIFWKLLKPFLGFIPSGIFIAYILTFSFWGDMFTRLGPSETYTVLGLAVYVWSLVSILRAAKNKEVPTNKALLAWVVSSLVCVGSKENYVLMILPNTLVSSYLIYQKTVSKAVLSAIVINTLITLFVGWAVYAAVSQAKTDVYGTSATATSRMHILNTGIRHIESKRMVVTGFLSFLLLAYLYLKKKTNSPFFKNTLILFLLTGAYELVFISQYVFYNGDWPNHSRYDFPGILVLPFFYLTLFLYFYTSIKLLKFKPFLRKGVLAGALFGLVAITVMNGYIATLVKAKENAVRTQAYTANVRRIADILNQNPDKTLIIESGNPWDYEVIFAYHKFLRAFGATNDMALKINGYSEETVNPGIEQELTSQMKAWSENGNADFIVLPVNPENCFSLPLSTTVTTNCEQL